MDEAMKKRVVDLMARGKLGDVIGEYLVFPQARELKIKSTGDTMLHLAISAERQYFASKMITASAFYPDTLEIGNEQGDTALHLAARFGNTYLCQEITNCSSRFIKIRNKFGETPIFSAVSSGKTEAFLYLNHRYKSQPNPNPELPSTSNGDTVLTRDSGANIHTRDDGDTILHSAISEQHFDLAYIIISEYPQLVHKANGEGLTPLHLLATKPSVFPSGVKLFGIRRLVYHRVCVQKLEKTPDLAKAPKPDHGWRSLFGPGKGLACITLAPEIRRDFCYFVDEERASVNLANHRKSSTATNGQVPTPLLTKVLRIALALLVAIVFTPFFCAFFCAFYMLWLAYILVKFAIRYEAYVRIKNIKKRCTWSVGVMNKLIPEDSLSHDLGQGGNPPLVIAAKHGISEIVLRIFGVNAGTILDVNSEKKNVIMLAVQHRHAHLYEDLLTQWDFKKTIFGQQDNEGNSLLHIAANHQVGQQFLRIRDAALHMQMEIKWYKFIKKSMPRSFFARHNKEGKTAKEIFEESHQHLIEEGRKGLTHTSQSCSLVAALIATVAFATSATYPGGHKQNDTGEPTLEHQTFFVISASSSLIALGSSMLSVVLFLSILTSNFKLKHFHKNLPRKLLWGLVSLLISIVSMYISFFAGHYFVLKQELHHHATLAYALFCFPLLVLIIVKFPLSFKTVWTTLSKNPSN